MYSMRSAAFSKRTLLFWCSNFWKLMICLKSANKMNDSKEKSSLTRCQTFPRQNTYENINFGNCKRSIVCPFHGWPFAPIRCVSSSNKRFVFWPFDSPFCIICKYIHSLDYSPRICLFIDSFQILFKLIYHHINMYTNSYNEFN